MCSFHEPRPRAVPCVGYRLNDDAGLGPRTLYEMTAEQEFKLQLLAEKWAPIKANFKPPDGWEGPDLWDPDKVEAIQRKNKLPVERSWQIVFNYRAPNSWEPEDLDGDGGVQAALSFDTLDELLNTHSVVIVRKMALSIAGRAAHEAMEWTTMEGKLVINPHGSDADMDVAADYVHAYLGNGAIGLNPPQGVYEAERRW